MLRFLIILCCIAAALYILKATGQTAAIEVIARLVTMSAWAVAVLLQIPFLFAAYFLLAITIIEVREYGAGNPLFAPFSVLQSLFVLLVILEFAGLLISMWRSWHGMPQNSTMAAVAGCLLVLAMTLCLIPIVRFRMDAHSMNRIISLVEGRPQPNFLAGNAYFAAIIACAISVVAWIAWVWGQ